MSYPGYPPYGQPDANPPYPQGYPGGAPCPYPSGGNSWQPQHMPQPGYSPAQAYPPGGSPYGGPPGGYPPPTGTYPPPQGSYPSPQGNYPPPQGSYPPPQGNYPPPHGGQQSYPPPGGVPVYPPSNAHQQGYGGSYGGGAHEHHSTPTHTNMNYAPTPHYGSASQPVVKKNPTVVPAQPFNPTGDAEILRKAMKGFGTDEKAIINVLAHRTNSQRLEIASQFKTLYGKDLIQNLKSELTGNFENLVVAMVTPLNEYYAREIREAISGLGTDEDVLVEVFCSLSNREIINIRNAYQQMYYQSLEDDLRGDTSGTFKRLMVSLCNAARDESTATNQAQAAADAQQLLEAGANRWGTDESTFNMILCQRNYNQLKLIFDEYQRMSGHDVEDAIKSEFSGDSEEGMLAIVRSAKSQPLFFARRLHKAIACIGTNDRDLIRLVVTRCEIDMGDIKHQYAAKYGQSLADDIKSDTSGDYKKCLIALIGE